MAVISYGLIATSLNPAATAETEWIVCPASHEYIGTVKITNLDASASTFRLAQTPASGASTAADWLIYDYSLDAGMHLIIPVELGPAETLRVYASNANVSFTYTGQDKDNS